jgi:hypothetical protein
MTITSGLEVRADCCACQGKILKTGCFSELHGAFLLIWSLPLYPAVIITSGSEPPPAVFTGLGQAQQSAVSFHISANSLENAVHDLNYSDGILRAATSNGVIEFDLETGERTRYSTDEGLPRNFIRSIYRDTNGINWIATRSNRIVDIENKNEIAIGYELDFVSVTEDNKGTVMGCHEWQRYSEDRQ